MNNLKTLVAMQLKDKLDFSFFKSWKQTLFKTIFALIKFALITAVIYVAFYLISMLRFVDLNAGIPDKFLLIIFTVMMTLSILGCTIGLVKSLYFAKDNQLLLTMPTNRVNIFFSKLIVYYLYELIRNIYFYLPLFFAFGLINGYPIYFYLWLVVAILVLTAVPVVVGALLSIPAMYICNFFRNFKILQYTTIVVLIALGVWAVVSLINLIPANFDIVASWGTIFWDVQDFMTSFATKALPFAVMLRMVVGLRYGMSLTLLDGTQWLYLGIVIASVAVLLGVCYLIVRPLFFKIASSPFEYKRVIEIGKHTNFQRRTFLSAVNKETLLNLRTPDKMYSLFGVAVGMPIAILLLNKIFSAMDTRLSGTFMTITFNILMIMLFALSSSTTMAKVYSEEGASAYLMKTNPQPYYKSLIAKLVPNAVVMTISILATCIVYGNFANSLVSIPLLFVSVECLYLGHLLWSAELDIMNPQNAQYATTGTHTNNPNEIKSTIYTFALSIIFAFMAYFILGEGTKAFWIKASIVSAIFLGFRIYFYLTKIKVYYKEK